MPDAKARGGRAFSVATCAPPDLEAEVDEGAEGSGGGASVGGASVGLTEGSREDLMDVDKEVDSSTLVSQSVAKRKLTTLTSEDDTVSSSSGQLPPTSTFTSMSSASSSMAPGEPSRKKAASVASSSKSNPQVPSSCRSKVHSSICSSGRAGGSRTTTKLSPKTTGGSRSARIDQFSCRYCP
jgi:hypothetical protein